MPVQGDAADAEGDGDLAGGQKMAYAKRWDAETGKLVTNKSTVRVTPPLRCVASTGSAPQTCSVLRLLDQHGVELVDTAYTV